MLIHEYKLHLYYKYKYVCLPIYLYLSLSLPLSFSVTQSIWSCCEPGQEHQNKREICSYLLPDRWYNPHRHIKKRKH